MEQPRANGILSERPDSIDVLILGDSESYNAISPLLLWDELGCTSYVCGTNSQRLPYTKTMLERVLEKQQPKLVILETLPIYRPIKLENLAFEEVSDLLPVFRYHDRWKSLTLADFVSPVTATASNPYQGHAHVTEVVPCGNEAYMIPTEEEAPIALVNQYYVRTIQDICTRHGARLLLVSTPSPVNWSYERHNGIQRFAQELDCPYLDLNLEPLGIDWTQDTFDQGDHLNHYGAVKVTRFLADYLRQEDLPDHRGDPAYETWEQKWQDYAPLLSQ